MITNHFYNRTIRKIVVAFGTLFNEINLIRYNKAGNVEYERIKVPLVYASKEKFLTRTTSDPTLTKSIATALPRMSFEMTGLEYDSSRKQTSLTKNFAYNTTTDSYNSQYAPIPYNFDFTLSIYVRNQEDGTQILEQILPFFTPDFTVTVDLIPSMDQKYDMPIMLNSVSPEIDYEGDMLTTRMVIWTLNFTVKSYIFPPVNTSAGIIRQANTSIYIEDGKTDAQKLYVDFATGNGVYTTGETITIDRDDRTDPITGEVVYFSNNVLGILIVKNLTETLQSADVVKGSYSLASYTIDSVDNAPLKAVTITTTPDPISAQPGDDFGFNETKTYWPDTLI